MTDIVGKLWGFCHTRRHDGIDYGNYLKDAIKGHFEIEEELKKETSQKRKVA